MKFVLGKWLIATFGLLFAAQIVPGIEMEGLYIALITAIILGLLNVLLKPFLFFLTLPITIVSLGLFTFVLNAIVFWFASSFIDGFVVDGFIPALLGSLVVSLVSLVGDRLLKKERANGVRSAVWKSE
jgi:putative membrane protein